MRSLYRPPFFRRALALLLALALSAESASAGLAAPALPSPASRPFLLFGDIHGDPAVQRSLVDAVRRAFVGRSGRIAVEGAAGDLDFRPYKALPFSDAVQATAARLLERGTIGAAADLGVQTDLRLTGVEDAALYRANVEAYRRSRAVDAKGALDRRAAGERREKDALFTGALKTFDDAVEGYRSKRLSLAAYVDALAAAGSLPASLAAFRDLARLEARLDLSEAERERRRFAAEFARVARWADAALLQSLSRPGAVDDGRLAALLRLGASRGMDLARYPALSDYATYRERAGALDADDLLSDVAGAERAAYLRLAAGDARRQALAARSRRTFLLRQMTDFSLTAREWRELAATAPTSEETTFAPFFAFYDAADRRNAALARRIISSGADAAILGGFHATEVARLLRADGRTVVFIRPAVRIGDAPSPAAALSTFAAHHAPLEKLLLRVKLLLAPPPELGAAPLVESAGDLAPYEFAAAYIDGVPPAERGRAKRAARRLLSLISSGVKRDWVRETAFLVPLALGVALHSLTLIEIGLVVQLIGLPAIHRAVDSLSGPGAIWAAAPKRLVWSLVFVDVTLAIQTAVARAPLPSWTAPVLGLVAAALVHAGNHRGVDRPGGWADAVLFGALRLPRIRMSSASPESPIVAGARNRMTAAIDEWRASRSPAPDVPLLDAIAADPVSRALEDALDLSLTDGLPAFRQAVLGYRQAIVAANFTQDQWAERIRRDYAVGLLWRRRIADASVAGAGSRPRDELYSISSELTGTLYRDVLSQLKRDRVPLSFARLGDMMNEGLRDGCEAVMASALDAWRAGRTVAGRDPVRLAWSFLQLESLRGGSDSATTVGEALGRAFFGAHLSAEDWGRRAAIDLRDALVTAAANPAFGEMVNTVYEEMENGLRTGGRGAEAAAIAAARAQRNEGVVEDMIPADLIAWRAGNADVAARPTEPVTSMWGRWIRVVPTLDPSQGGPDPVDATMETLDALSLDAAERSVVFNSLGEALSLSLRVRGAGAVVIDVLTRIREAAERRWGADAAFVGPALEAGWEAGLRRFFVIRIEDWRREGRPLQIPPRESEAWYELATETARAGFSIDVMAGAFVAASRDTRMAPHELEPLFTRAIVMSETALWLHGPNASPALLTALRSAELLAAEAPGPRADAGRRVASDWSDVKSEMDSVLAQWKIDRKSQNVIRALTKAYFTELIASDPAAGEREREQLATSIVGARFAPNDWAVRAQQDFASAVTYWGQTASAPDAEEAAVDTAFGFVRFVATLYIAAAARNTGNPSSVGETYAALLSAVVSTANSRKTLPYARARPFALLVVDLAHGAARHYAMGRAGDNAMTAVNEALAALAPHPDTLGVAEKVSFVSGRAEQVRGNKELAVALGLEDAVAIEWNRLATSPHSVDDWATFFNDAVLLLLAMTDTAAHAHAQEYIDALVRLERESPAAAAAAERGGGAALLATVAAANAAALEKDPARLPVLQEAAEEAASRVSDPRFRAAAAETIVRAAMEACRTGDPAALARLDSLVEATYGVARDAVSAARFRAGARRFAALGVLRTDRADREELARTWRAEAKSIVTAPGVAVDPKSGVGSFRLLLLVAEIHADEGDQKTALELLARLRASIRAKGAGGPQTIQLRQVAFCEMTVLLRALGPGQTSAAAVAQLLNVFDVDRIDPRFLDALRSLVSPADDLDARLVATADAALSANGGRLSAARRRLIVRWIRLLNPAGADGFLTKWGGLDQETDAPRHAAQGALPWRVGGGPLAWPGFRTLRREATYRLGEYRTKMRAIASRLRGAPNDPALQREFTATLSRAHFDAAIAADAGLPDEAVGYLNVIEPDATPRRFPTFEEAWRLGLVSYAAAAGDARRAIDEAARHLPHWEGRLPDELIPSVVDAVLNLDRTPFGSAAEYEATLGRAARVLSSNVTPAMRGDVLRGLLAVAERMDDAAQVRALRLEAADRSASGDLQAAAALFDGIRSELVDPTLAPPARRAAAAESMLSARLALDESREAETGRSAAVALALRYEIAVQNGEPLSAYLPEALNLAALALERPDTGGPFIEEGGLGLAAEIVLASGEIGDAAPSVARVVNAARGWLGGDADAQRHLFELAIDGGVGDPAALAAWLETSNASSMDPVSAARWRLIAADLLDDADGRARAALALTRARPAWLSPVAWRERVEREFAFSPLGRQAWMNATLDTFLDADRLARLGLDADAAADWIGVAGVFNAGSALLLLDELIDGGRVPAWNSRLSDLRADIQRDFFVDPEASGDRLVLHDARSALQRLDLSAAERAYSWIPAGRRTGVVAAFGRRLNGLSRAYAAYQQGDDARAAARLRRLEASAERDALLARVRLLRRAQRRAESRPRRADALLRRYERSASVDSDDRWREAARDIRSSADRVRRALDRIRAEIASNPREWPRQALIRLQRAAVAAYGGDMDSRGLTSQLIGAAEAAAAKGYARSAQAILLVAHSEGMMNNAEWENFTRDADLRERLDKVRRAARLSEMRRFLVDQLAVYRTQVEAADFVAAETARLHPSEDRDERTIDFQFAPTWQVTAEGQLFVPGLFFAETAAAVEEKGDKKKKGAAKVNLVPVNLDRATIFVSGYSFQASFTDGNTHAMATFVRRDPGKGLYFSLDAMDVDRLRALQSRRVAGALRYSEDQVLRRKVAALEHAIAFVDRALESPTADIANPILSRLLGAVITPVTQPPLSDEERAERDTAQASAVNATRAGAPVVAVQGPPGTGKTYTAVRVAAAAARERRQIVVVTAPAHAGADAFAQQAINAGLTVVRAASRDAGAKVTRLLTDVRRAYDDRLTILMEALERHNAGGEGFVYVSTNNGLHGDWGSFQLLQMYLNGASMNEIRFRYMKLKRLEADRKDLNARHPMDNHGRDRGRPVWIQDEAGQADAAEVLVALYALRPDAAYFFGDHLQLAPHGVTDALARFLRRLAARVGFSAGPIDRVLSRAALRAMSTSLFEMFYEYGERWHWHYEDGIRTAGVSTHFLAVARRSIWFIVDTVVNVFYGGRLSHTKADHPRSEWDPVPGDAVLVIATNGAESRVGQSQGREESDVSFRNFREAGEAVRMASYYLNTVNPDTGDLFEAKEILMLTPYRGQLTLINETLRWLSIANDLAAGENVSKEEIDQMRDLVMRHVHASGRLSGGDAESVRTLLRRLVSERGRRGSIVPWLFEALEPVYNVSFSGDRTIRRSDVSQIVVKNLAERGRGGREDAEITELLGENGGDTYDEQLQNRLEAKTVHRVQGQERSAVIVSLARVSGPNFLTGANGRRILNVAFSRPKQKLAIIYSRGLEVDALRKIEDNLHRESARLGRTFSVLPEAPRAANLLRAFGLSLGTRWDRWMDRYGAPLWETAAFLSVLAWGVATQSPATIGAGAVMQLFLFPALHVAGTRLGRSEGYRWRPEWRFAAALFALFGVSDVALLATGLSAGGAALGALLPPLLWHARRGFRASAAAMVGAAPAPARVGVSSVAGLGYPADVRGATPDTPRAVDWNERFKAAEAVRRGV